MAKYTEEQRQRAEDFVKGYVVGKMQEQGLIDPQDILPVFLGQVVDPGIDRSTIVHEDPRIMPWVDAFEDALKDRLTLHSLGEG